MQKNKWLLKNCDSLKGRRVVVTGATGGLGKELCFYLAMLNANITLACRNENLALSLKKDILNKYPKANIDFVQLDLSCIKSVDNAIEKIKMTEVLYETQQKEIS